MIIKTVGTVGTCYCITTNDWNDCCRFKVESNCPACGVKAMFENEFASQSPNRLCEDCATNKVATFISGIEMGKVIYQMRSK